MADIRKLIAEAADAARGTIRAYHGSPHSFDRFNASKIGTGEGAQSYGHGLYFAGNEDVARAYRDALRWGRQDAADPAVRAAMWAQRHGGTEEAAVALQNNIDNSMLGRNSWDAQLNRGAIDYLRSGSQLPDLPKGHMYEVDLGYPDDALLDIDRPFSGRAGILGSEVLRKYNPASISEDTLRALQDGSWRFDVTSYPYQAAGVDLAKMAKHPSGAAALRDAGIPGVRYLDQLSRGATGNVTRNYVIFPGAEDRIQILRRYGLLPPLMAPALMGDE